MILVFSREPNNASSRSLTSRHLVCSHERDFLADFTGVGSIRDASPVILSSIAATLSVMDIMIDMTILSIFSFVSTIPLCRCSTGADRPVTMHFWRVGTNVYMVG